MTPQKPEGPQWKRASKTLIFWVVVIAISLLLSQRFSSPRQGLKLLIFEDFYSQLQEGKVKFARVEDRTLFGTYSDLPEGLAGDEDVQFDFKTVLPTDIDFSTLERWRNDYGLKLQFKENAPNFWSYVFSALPWLLLVGFWIYIIRRMQGGGNKGVFSFGKSRAKMFLESQTRVTFADVAGAIEAKQELQEIVEFLKDPDKFQRLGGKIPKGALLLGPPGTGKTLLARAVAGEAGVPFFSMSGADFVEMFVGVGASRVRDLFEQGKKHAPCIIFIDELDAVGRHRGAGLGGGHDEREQTLNQLLVEMDGFETNEGVILLAATNRPDVLDSALLRPGRFDRQIVVDRPDVRGREGILKVHTRNIPLEKDVDMTILAKGTPGFSGADLANMVNEAALLGARKGKNKVEMEDFEEAKDKVLMGTERKSLLISDEEKRSTAYHEAGHALVANLIPDLEPVHKVTIIPRGRAGGFTAILPNERMFASRDNLFGKLRILLAGRAAEKLVFDTLTTGASDDIKRATELSRKMVCEWGMSDVLGPMAFGEKQEEIFLGREISQHRDYSEETARLIDTEIRKLIQDAQDDVDDLIKQNEEKLHAIAAALLERETLFGEEIELILRGEKLPSKKKRKSTAAPARAKGTRKKKSPTSTSTDDA
ncbi:ATP-dependent zinc metalloprotease FtsH [candidate division KSB1 bacterium]|nr:ATP-dependent zinc metalloprotease FtsH [candidate division KSB1 bacterium]